MNTPSLQGLFDINYQLALFDMDISIDYTNRCITASYESFDFDKDKVTEPIFSKTILDHIRLSESTAAEICTLANVDFRLISRAQAKATYQPSKSIVLALGMALKLTEPLMGALIQSANYEWSHIAKRYLLPRL